MAETTTELEILKIFLNINSDQNWPEEPETGQLLSIALLTDKEKNTLLNKTQTASSLLCFKREKGEKKMYGGKIREGKERETEETRMQRQTTKALAELRGAMGLVRSERKIERSHKEWGGKV